MKPTAYKLKIEDLVRGRYVRSADGSEPPHLLTPWNQRVTRARIMGTVIDKFVREDQTYAALRVDDGSETISVRAWREDVPGLDKIGVGSTIDIIGRVREFEGEIYLVPELVIPVEDHNWELVRELEIIESRRKALAEGIWPRPASSEKLESSTPSTGAQTTVHPEYLDEEPPLPQIPDETKKKIFLALEKLDRGGGATVSEISRELNLPPQQVEEAMRVFLVKGDIFEPTAGKFKLTR